MAETYAHDLPFGAALQDDGARFRLWTPGRVSLVLLVRAATLVMAPAEDGWLELTTTTAGAVLLESPPELQRVARDGHLPPWSVIWLLAEVA